MLPDTYYLPPAVAQNPISLAVPGNIAADFVAPELRIGLGRNVMLRTAVPVTPVHEHGNALPRENKVGCPAKTCDRSPRRQISEAERMRSSSDGKFGTRVAAAISLHHTPCCGGFGPRVLALRHADSLGRPARSLRRNPRTETAWVVDSGTGVRPLAGRTLLQRGCSPGRRRVGCKWPTAQT